MPSRKNGESLTTKILVQIRDELRNTNQRLDTTNQRLDAVVHEQVKMRTKLVELQEAQHEFGQILGMAVKELQALGNRIDNVYFGAMGKTVREHEERIVRLEKQSGLASM